jgi:hypothetical protein
MPGPIADCAISTGAIFSTCKIFIDGAISFLSAETNSPRVAIEAPAFLFRQARTIEDASILSPALTPILFVISVRTGHVAVTVNPAASSPPKKVSQPVETFPLSSDSLALKA